MDSAPDKSWANFMIPGKKPAKTIKLMADQELLGDWKQAKMGDYVQVSILQSLAERIGVYDLGSTMGTNRPTQAPKNG
ncbi:MAG: hypothetical protein E6R03_15455 [Hyphomicrobiaceae bacterium]|nr:MAG: hypothetical protein E6R03_15455 [Hyphomicrobiaceae bacterium]